MIAGAREEWLQRLVDELRPMYGGELPETVHVSVGFPSAGMRSAVIGECWNPSASSDGAPQVFIHPKIGTGIDAADTLAHELVHACRPDAHHGPKFKELALRIGLVGRMTSAGAGDELSKKLVGICKRLGEYPHPALKGSHRPATEKQSTRMLKVQCPACDYTVRTTRKWVDVGLPSCPEGDVMQLVTTTTEEGTGE